MIGETILKKATQPLAEGGGLRMFWKISTVSSLLYFAFLLLLYILWIQPSDGIGFAFTLLVPSVILLIFLSLFSGVFAPTLFFISIEILLPNKPGYFFQDFHIIYTWIFIQLLINLYYLIINKKIKFASTKKFIIFQIILMSVIAIGLSYLMITFWY